MTQYDTIEVEVRGHTACVTLNRPEVLNAINDEMIAELALAYAEIERSEDIWTVIITGAGRALCVGADVNKAADHDMENVAGIDNQGDPILSSMRQWDAPQEATPPWLQMTKPIICAVNGIACGAGMDLVTTADITIASERATLMDPHVSIGVTSGREGVRLARILPLPVAMRLILMGKHEQLDAQRAYDLGVFTEVVAHDFIDGASVGDRRHREFQCAAGGPGFAVGRAQGSHIAHIRGRTAGRKLPNEGCTDEGRRRGTACLPREA